MQQESGSKQTAWDTRRGLEQSNKTQKEKSEPATRNPVLGKAGSEETQEGFQFSKRGMKRRVQVYSITQIIVFK